MKKAQKTAATTRQRLLVTVFVLFLSWVMGLTPGYAQPAGAATVRGQVNSAEGDTIFLAWHPSLLDDHEQRILGNVDEDGSFALSLPMDGPRVAELVYGTEAMTIWLEPGAELNVRFKGGQMPTSIKFKGQLAAENTYLADYEREFGDNEDWQVLPYNIMFYEEGFVKYLDHRLERERAELANFLEERSEDGLSTAFKDYAEAELAYAWANDRLMYQDLREQVVANEGRLALTPGYFDFLRVVQVDKPSALPSPGYQTFLTNYLAWQMRYDHHRRADPDFFTVAYKLAKERFSGEVEAVMLGRILRDSFRNGFVQQSQALFDDYRTTVDTHGRYVPLLLTEFEATRTLALGAQAPRFKLPTIKGDTVSIDTFRGKMVYLTFWRTTSGQALRDLPYQQDLARKLRGKVEFLSVAFDEDPEGWRRTVVNKNLEGHHVYGGVWPSAELARAYNLTELPTYLLLAEDGSIASRRLLKMSHPGAQAELLNAMGRVKLPEPPPPAPDSAALAAAADSIAAAKNPSKLATAGSTPPRRTVVRRPATKSPARRPPYRRAAPRRAPARD